MNTIQNKIKSVFFSNKGYTLLFSVLTAALVLGVAVFILSVSVKQYELSASARNSVYSFYAADAGVECVAAAYSGLRGDSVSATTPPGTTVTCNNQTVTVGNFTPSATTALQFLSGVILESAPLSFGLANGTCSVVTIYEGYDTGGVHYMIFDSRGYNHCTSANGPDISNPTTVERALRLTKKG
jgi:hypothetical protein